MLALLQQLMNKEHYLDWGHFHYHHKLRRPKRCTLQAVHLVFLVRQMLFGLQQLK